MFIKDCDAVLDYRVDWRDTCIGDLSIDESRWAVEPEHEGGIEISNAGIGDKVTNALFGGGSPGFVYHIGNSVTLSDGRIDERSFTLRVEER